MSEYGLVKAGSLKFKGVEKQKKKKKEKRKHDGEGADSDDALRHGLPAVCVSDRCSKNTLGLGGIQVQIVCSGGL